MVKKIKHFWSAGYQSDPVAFYFEIISFVFTVSASLYLAMTADAPDMRFVYPGFFIGALAGTYGYYRRKLAWPMTLTMYFILVNVFGFGRAMGWY